MGELADRRRQTGDRLVKLQAELSDAEVIARGKACVYVTGSFGRCEASSYSDLDLFIVGKADGEDRSRLNHLDEICLKADLIEVTRKLEIPEFSGDGRYLTHYSVGALTKTLGAPEDDVTNTFTARLLLLLESRPLVEPEVYRNKIGDVVAAYWRDYEDHKTDFMPAFLANDILRLWRTFCVNYEARTERVPDREKAKGKLKNYKLKHSRLLTCYSSILFLLAVYSKHHTVNPDAVLEMIGMTPTERLEWLLQQPELGAAHSKISELLAQYEKFLRNTNAKEEDLITNFMKKSASRQYLSEAYRFGDSVFDALSIIGKSNRFHRLLVV